MDGKNGPPKKPTALVKANGSWRICEREGEVKPESIIPAPPSIIKGDKERAMYFELGLKLFRLGLMTELDGPKLATLCNSYYEYEHFNNELGKLPAYYYVSVSGSLVIHPFVGLRNAALDQLNRSLTVFGMSPTARAGLKVEAPKNKNKKDKKEADEFFATGT